MKKKTLTKRNTADLSLAGAGRSSSSYLAVGSWRPVVETHGAVLGPQTNSIRDDSVVNGLSGRVRAWDVVLCWASTLDQRFGRGCAWDTRGCLRGTVSSPDGSHGREQPIYIGNKATLDRRHSSEMEAGAQIVMNRVGQLRIALHTQGHQDEWQCQRWRSALATAMNDSMAICAHSLSARTAFHYRFIAPLVYSPITMVAPSSPTQTS